MIDPYEEVIHGERLLRIPPRQRHEAILDRLHARVKAALETTTTSSLLGRREPVSVSATTILRPDLALLTAANQRLWLVAEVVSPEDHHADTVDKKAIYEELRVPRLWMVDPRYDNVEVYHGTQFGLTLKRVLAGREVLTESLLPSFQLALHELFAGSFDERAPAHYDY